MNSIKFNNKKDSFYNAVCINSAFGLILNNNDSFNKDNINKALEEVESVISSKKPLEVINTLSKFTNC